MANRIVLNTISYHGAGAIQEIPGELQRRGYKKVFVCTDPDLVKFGVATKVTDLLDEAGIAYSVYSDIKPNPTIQNVTDGVEAFKAAEADSIVTIGGGSAMDTAKAIGVIITNPEFADVRSLEGVAPTKNHAVFTIAVPTTAGTAAEVTINYVITDVEKVRKFVCVDTNDAPEVAVVDPEMMATMPAGLTASTGMDALTHAIEAYIGRSTNRLTRAMSEEAATRIVRSLYKAYTDGGDMQARADMLRAAYCAGVSFTRSYVGYVHGVAHSLGGQYGVPHGLANAVILPYFLDAYGAACHKKLGKLARIAGVASPNAFDSEAAEAFIRWIRETNAKMGIPETIPQIRTVDIPEMAHHAAKESNPLYPVPVLMDEGRLAQMYLKLMPAKEENA